MSKEEQEEKAGGVTEEYDPKEDPDRPNFNGWTLEDYLEYLYGEEND